MNKESSWRVQSVSEFVGSVIKVTYLLRYFVEVPSAASGPSHCPTTLIYLYSSPATSLSSGKCIQQPGACLVL